jgi:DNA topoisomerase IA
MQNRLPLQQPDAPPPRSGRAARIKRIVVVPSRATMDQVGTALSERGPKAPPEAASFSATAPLERYGDTLLIQLSERLFELVPAEKRKRNSADDLPWKPTKFETRVYENISWDRAALDKLVDIIRAGADVIDLTEANSSASQTLEDFLIFDLEMHTLAHAVFRRAKIDFDDDTHAVNRALETATTRELDVASARARRLRAEIDYTFAVNLNAMVRDRLRAGNYRLDKDVDLNVSLVSTVIITALARQNDRLAALRTPMRWIPMALAEHGNTPVAFNVIPLPPEDISYNDALAMVDRIAGDVVIQSVEHQESTVPPPPPHTLPTLYSELEKQDPGAWTPDKLRSALANLVKKGCITNPWRTSPRYPAWSIARIARVLTKIYEINDEISALATLPRKGAKIEGDNPRIVALTPLGRAYDEPEPLPKLALLEITRRWVAQLLGPATMRTTRYTGRLPDGTRLAAETRSYVQPGWRLTLPPSDDADPTPIATLARLTLRERRVHPYEGPVPEQYRIGTLLEDLLEPERLIWEQQLRDDLPTGITLASPEHILSIIERQLASGVIRRNNTRGWLDLSEHGRAIYDVLPDQLRHPAFVLAFRSAFRKTGGDVARLDSLKAYAYEQLDHMITTMRKRVPKSSGSWRTHNRQEVRH